MLLKAWSCEAVRIIPGVNEAPEASALGINSPVTTSCHLKWALHF